MARKPPDWHEPSLFPPDPGNTPEPEDQSPPNPEGDQHAVQDNRPGIPATTTGDTRTAPEEQDAAPSAGVLRQGAEDDPRSLEGNPVPGETGQRPQPDR